MPSNTALGTPLSDRELSIVRLVAMGRRNWELAQELGISTRTVEAHLRNIYAKTGSNNRVQVSNWLLDVSE